MATLRDRVERLEMVRGNDAEDQVFTLPGIRIAVGRNGAVFIIYRSEVVSSAFANALLAERFPQAWGGIILPDNHRCPATCEQLGCPPEEREGADYA